ncbi:MAG: 50S ribosomal protein L25/general stress protein Ctc [Henriciella sp.]|jgi:large subunit ribosomal protein L25|uniref:50S ribosomal protein L25/general stress protein Ctc n=1 Tax=Henriciella sp. TaxID=1968823 RepID=UPI000C0EA239|nr:50S ribosomal protein L25/general stress protein Ctc [Henriciella sp.]MAN75449.1 50S ribosomal protein L25/general stress protein Ctc [Henriciella sp.]MBF34940.1 50S ribosomal protein L25/general stress protein Ctc [Hyphomonadaceae bacterium]PHR80516.1 MAG: 50S ribosomal protein L25/general stress protein Ctc [Henriciella sp.]|tara:strand:- start:353 stop:1045 length:693 start_codon:yes stop_codon:yes gene_type:complete
MSEKLNYNVQIRERIGKGGAREARRNGMVPGVLYGGGEDPVAVSLKLNEVIKGINSGHFLTSTANLVHDGKKQLVIPQAIQLHPVTDMPVHVDLYRVNASQIIAVEVPVHFTNEEEAPGIKEGGALNIVRFAVELNVRADSIPDSLEADLTGLEIGDNVKISDIKLPEGAEPTITDRDFTIATIVGQMAEVVEEDEEELEADDVEAINQSDEDGEGEAEGDAEGEDESKE